MATNIAHPQPAAASGPFEGHLGNANQFIGHGDGLIADIAFLARRDAHSPPSSPSSTRAGIVNMSQPRIPSRTAVPPPPPPPLTTKQSTGTDSDQPRDRQPPPPPPPVLLTPPPSFPLAQSPWPDTFDTQSTAPSVAPSSPQTSSAATRHDLPNLRRSSSPGSASDSRDEDTVHRRFGGGRLQAAPYVTRIRVPITDGDNSSDSSDIFDTYNHQFPPLLPTVGSRIALLRERKQLTHAISNTVVQTETWASKLGQARLPLSRPAPASYSGSEASFSSYSHEEEDDEEIQLLWVDLKEKRKSVAQAKVTMTQLRRRMQQLRRKKLEAEVSFMSLVRRMLPRNALSQSNVNGSDQLLEQRFAEMQRLNTEYRHMELNYEDLENNLDDEEAILNGHEVKFFSVLAKEHLRTGSRSQASPGNDLPKQPEYLRNTPYLLLGISRNGPAEDEHPFWKDLVSAIGDMNLALEDLSEHRMRYEVLQNDVRLQPMVGKKISAEDENFMADFPRLEVIKQVRVDEAIQQVHRLRDKCKLHGVEKKYPSYTVAYTLDQNLGEDLSLEDQWPSSHTLEHHQFPTILSSPDHVLRTPEPLTALDDLRLVTRLPPDHPGKGRQYDAALKEYGIHQLVYDVGPKDDPMSHNEDDGDLVLRWLLHQLRTSPLEAHRLAAIFRQQTNLAIKDYERWQDDVLYHWWHDGTSSASRRSPRNQDNDGSVAVDHHLRDPSVWSKAWSGASSRRLIRSRSSSNPLPMWPATWPIGKPPDFTKPALSDSATSV